MKPQGQNEDYDAVKAKAEKIGAERMIIQNLQQELVEELVWPAVQCTFGHPRAKCTTFVHGYANIP